jgi:hypothetical protein
MLMRAVYLGIYKGQYRLLKYYGAVLSFADVLYTSVCLEFLKVFGVMMWAPASLDICVMIPKVVLFVFGLADRFFKVGRRLLDTVANGSVIYSTV